MRLLAVALLLTIATANASSNLYRTRVSKGGLAWVRLGHRGEPWQAAGLTRDGVAACDRLHGGRGPPTPARHHRRPPPPPPLHTRCRRCHLPLPLPREASCSHPLPPLPHPNLCPQTLPARARSVLELPGSSTAPGAGSSAGNSSSAVPPTAVIRTSWSFDAAAVDCDTWDGQDFISIPGMLWGEPLAGQRPCAHLHPT